MVGKGSYISLGFFCTVFLPNVSHIKDVSSVLLVDNVKKSNCNEDYSKTSATLPFASGYIRLHTVTNQPAPRILY